MVLDRRRDGPEVGENGDGIERRRHLAQQTALPPGSHVVVGVAAVADVGERRPAVEQVPAWFDVDHDPLGSLPLRGEPHVHRFQCVDLHSPDRVDEVDEPGHVDQHPVRDRDPECELERVCERIHRRIG